MILDAFHLPALPDVPTETRRYERGGASVELRLPRLDAGMVAAQADALREARVRHLADRPVAEIVAAVDRAAARLLDREDPLRQAAEEALPAVTGYAPEMVTLVLDRMAADWRAPALETLLRADLGDPAALDGWVPRRGAPGETRAFGPALALHVFSGNVPGVAVTSLVRALLVKAASLGKTAAGEPLLPALFARALADVDPELGACVAVAHWRGGDEAPERAALEAAEAVIVYGGREAVESYRRRTPAGARFVAYGHRLSFGVAAREALSSARAERTAEAFARDASAFDQQGCVSPHLVYAERGGEVEPRAWARMLAAAMEREAARLPRGPLAPDEAAAIRQLRGEAEFAELAGEGTELHASAGGTAWTVVWEEDAAFAPSCLNRVVRVKPVERLDDVPGLVGEIGSLLQSVGVAAPSDRRRSLAAELGRLGASRVVPAGEMAWPPAAWHHDGRPPLGELLRWCDLEA